MTKLNNYIYLIDDDLSMLNSLQRMLEDVGYDVKAFNSAQSFLNEAIPLSPAVILLDMQMPVVRGLELQESLKRLGWTTPIIFISGQSQPIEIVQSLKRGAIDFLLKPFNLEALLSAISVAIEFDKKQLIRTTQEVKIMKCYESLTPREKEVCHWLLRGLRNKDIAIKLGTTDATIKVHKSRVLEKMRVTTVPQLIGACLHEKFFPRE
jgi:FixJ family two-component response regulator